MSELTIENLCCVCCAEDVEAAVGAIPGVRRASVDLERGVLRVERISDDSSYRVREAVHALGYRIAGEGKGPSAAELAHEGVALNIIQRQLGHANLGTTSIYLQGIDTEEIIATVHGRRGPMMSATAGLRL
jgi:copper chaperone CopZ